MRRPKDEIAVLQSTLAGPSRSPPPPRIDSSGVAFEDLLPVRSAFAFWSRREWITAGSEGRLVTCEHDTRRVTRTEHDGGITVLADSHAGRKLNSPNDVVVARDGRAPARRIGNPAFHSGESTEDG